MTNKIKSELIQPFTNTPQIAPPVPISILKPPVVSNHTHIMGHDKKSNYDTMCECSTAMSMIMSRISDRSSDADMKTVKKLMTHMSWLDTISITIANNFSSWGHNLN